MQKQGMDAVTFVNGTLKYGSEQAMQATTLYEAASTTKTLTAVLVLKKVVAGATSLDATAKSILGSKLPAKLLVVGGVDVTGDITLQQLLMHTSGLPTFWADGPNKTVLEWYNVYQEAAPAKSAALELFVNMTVNRFVFLGIARPALEPSMYSPTKIWLPTEVLELVPFYDPFPIGQYHYADTNYIILGLVVEELYSKALDQAIQQHLYAPLLLKPPTDTLLRYDFQTSPPTDRAAEGTEIYTRLSHRYSHDWLGTYDDTMSDPDHFEANRVITNYFESPDWASGGAITSAEESGVMWAALMRSTAAPWTDVQALMLEGPVVPILDGGYYGLGVMKYYGWVGHTGDGGAQLYYLPEGQVVVTGTNNNNQFELTNFLIQHKHDICQCSATALAATTNSRRDPLVP